MNNKKMIILILSIIFVFSSILFFLIHQQQTTKEIKQNNDSFDHNKNNTIEKTKSTEVVVDFADKYQKILPNPVKPIALEEIDQTETVTDIPKPTEPVELPEKI